MSFAIHIVTFIEWYFEKIEVNFFISEHLVTFATCSRGSLLVPQILKSKQTNKQKRYTWQILLQIRSMAQMYALKFRCLDIKTQLNYVSFRGSKSNWHSKMKKAWRFLTPNWDHVIKFYLCEFFELLISSITQNFYYWPTPKFGSTPAHTKDFLTHVKRTYTRNSCNPSTHATHAI